MRDRYVKRQTCQKLNKIAVLVWAARHMDLLSARLKRNQRKLRAYVFTTVTRAATISRHSKLTIKNCLQIFLLSNSHLIMDVCMSSAVQKRNVTPVKSDHIMFIYIVLYAIDSLNSSSFTVLNMKNQNQCRFSKNYNLIFCYKAALQCGAS